MPPSGDEENLKKQIASEFISILTNAMEESCFSRCIKKPGIKLEKADEVCLAKCMDRYLESWNIVSHTVGRIQDKLGSQMSTAEQQAHFINPK